MSRLKPVLLGALLEAASACGPRSGDPPGGSALASSAAPDFTLNDPDGKSITLSSFRGKAVLLNFWFLG